MGELHSVYKLPVANGVADSAMKLLTRTFYNFLRLDEHEQLRAGESF